MPLRTLGRNAGADGIADLIEEVSLHTDDPGVGSANEISGGGYARVATNGSAWGEASGRTANNAVISFPTPTGAWGIATHFQLHGSSGPLADNPLTNARNIPIGSNVRFAAGSLGITINA